MAMKIKDLFKKFSIGMILNRLLELFPEDKSLRNDYAIFLTRIKSLAERLNGVSNSDFLVLVIRRPEQDLDLLKQTVCSGKYSARDIRELLASDSEVIGVSINSNSFLALEFEPWDEWLKSYFVSEFDDLDTLCYIIREMTFVSFDEEEIVNIKEYLDKLSKILEEVDYHGNLSSMWSTSFDD